MNAKIGILPQSKSGIGNIMRNLSKEHFMNEFGIKWEEKQKIYQNWLDICKSKGFHPDSIIKSYELGEKLHLSDDLKEVFEMIIFLNENSQEITESKKAVQNQINEKIDGVLTGINESFENYIINNGIYIEGITPKQAKITFVSFLKKYFKLNGKERFIQILLNGDNIEISQEITSFLIAQIVTGKIKGELKDRYIDSIISGIGYLLDSELDGTQEGGLVSEILKVA